MIRLKPQNVNKMTLEPVLGQIFDDFRGYKVNRCQGTRLTASIAIVFSDALGCADSFNRARHDLRGSSSTRIICKARL